jgi:hypothetical protein
MDISALCDFAEPAGSGNESAKMRIGSGIGRPAVTCVFRIKIDRIS